MPAAPVVFESRLDGLALLKRGKVRDIYAIDEDSMLFVASDRLSAFDVVLPDPVPGKGVLLTALSNFWFARTQDLIANHLTGREPEDLQLSAADYGQVQGRGVIVKKLQPLPVEAIVRGYLIGSGWEDYQADGAICGVKLPRDLQQAAQLPEPIFTPSTKAAVGEHDANINFDQTAKLIGTDLARQVRDISLAIYQAGAAYAAARGIIIADTKFEFGTDAAGKLYLIDEVLTPDSSRFWPADEYRPGISPPSFDKQYVRDYLATLDWDKQSPGPHLPEQVIANTLTKYRQAHDRLLQDG
ncbi:MAG: phosphoribosylaminoimidazolesuccinocarboxamide synthase [Gammaproteobacteria bacterium]